MLELDEGKLSRPVLRRGGESNLASLSRPVCSSVKPCVIGENLLSVSDPISRPEERRIDASALVRPPALQHRTVSRLHSYAALERSASPMSSVSEPQRWSLGRLPLPARTATLPL